MTGVEAASRRVALGAFSRVQGGLLELIEPDGRRFRFGDAAADVVATVKVNSMRFYRSLLSGSIGLGEAYRDRLWDCDDLVALLRIACRNLGSLDRWRRRLHPLLVPLERTLWRVPRNSKRASRRHISEHYDLGNDLFALYLDESMMYSSAVFPNPDASLAEAQVNHLERICQALELGPEDHLLEIGTGWGAMAAYAADN
jgi:cyclopropane-fatty-acyl-phospholipid synthase